MSFPEWSCFGRGLGLNAIQNTIPCWAGAGKSGQHASIDPRSPKWLLGQRQAKGWTEITAKKWGSMFVRGLTPSPCTFAFKALTVGTRPARCRKMSVKASSQEVPAKQEEASEYIVKAVEEKVTVLCLWRW